MITIRTKIPELVGQKVKIGWFSSAQYPDGTPVAYVAVIQENGAPEQNIPARPFMGPADTKNRQAWIGLMEQGAQAVLNGSQSIGQVLDKVGMRVEGDIAKAIVAVQEPPLSPVTIQKRLDKRKDKTVTPTLTKPLVDTGLMLASISHTIGKAAKG
jgi:hypothetical protein